MSEAQLGLAKDDSISSKEIVKERIESEAYPDDECEDVQEEEIKCKPTMEGSPCGNSRGSVESIFEESNDVKTPLSSPKKDSSIPLTIKDKVKEDTSTHSLIDSFNDDVDSSITKEKQCQQKADEKPAECADMDIGSMPSAEILLNDSNVSQQKLSFHIIQSIYIYSIIDFSMIIELFSKKN